MAGSAPAAAKAPRSPPSQAPLLPLLSFQGASTEEPPIQFVGGREENHFGAPSGSKLLQPPGGRRAPQPTTCPISCAPQPPRKHCPSQTTGKVCLC